MALNMQLTAIDHMGWLRIEFLDLVTNNKWSMKAKILRQWRDTNIHFTIQGGQELALSEQWFTVGVSFTYQDGRDFWDHFQRHGFEVDENEIEVVKYVPSSFEQADDRLRRLHNYAQTANKVILVDSLVGF